MGNQVCQNGAASLLNRQVHRSIACLIFDISAGPSLEKDAGNGSFFSLYRVMKGCVALVSLCGDWNLFIDEKLNQLVASRFYTQVHRSVAVAVCNRETGAMFNKQAGVECQAPVYINQQKGNLVAVGDVYISSLSYQAGKHFRSEFVEPFHKNCMGNQEKTSSFAVGVIDIAFMFYQCVEHVSIALFNHYDHRFFSPGTRGRHISPGLEKGANQAVAVRFYSHEKGGFPFR